MYQNKEGKAIEYLTIPFKKENVLALGCNQDLIFKMIEKSDEKGLEQVTFNPANAKNYWAKKTSPNRLVYE